MPLFGSFDVMQAFRSDVKTEVEGVIDLSRSINTVDYIDIKAKFQVNFTHCGYQPGGFM